MHLFNDCIKIYFDLQQHAAFCFLITPIFGQTKPSEPHLEMVSKIGFGFIKTKGRTCLRTQQTYGFKNHARTETGLRQYALRIWALNTNTDTFSYSGEAFCHVCLRTSRTYVTLVPLYCTTLCSELAINYS